MRVLLTALLLTGCGGGGLSSPIETTPVPVEPAPLPLYAPTPNHRFGLKNDWVVTAVGTVRVMREVPYLDVDVEVVIPPGATWESDWLLTPGPYSVTYPRNPGGGGHANVTYVPYSQEAWVIR